MLVRSCATEHLRDPTIAAPFHLQLTKLTPKSMWAENRRGEGPFSVDAASAVPRGTAIPEERCARIASVAGRIVGGSDLDQRREIPSFCSCRLSPKTIVCSSLLFLQIVRIPKVIQTAHSMTLFSYSVALLSHNMRLEYSQIEIKIIYTMRDSYIRKNAKK
ncbi:hypothetical protein CDAR_78711 [Caerostris darwini]|uniref:Uncharacterized protein n=1 Tax=Caerostris darwini TaxID=1538125 RepID=A0AAV4QXH7_9ARAC|nr:hypothetical protein CDAR_78711 [Caerostris darwini]